MPNDLIPYRSSLALRERRAVSEVREAKRPARRSAARLDAAAIVTRVGLAHVEMLTAAEVAICNRQGATADLRAQMIVDSYCALVVSEVNGLALRGES
ncbi:MAG TPA: hypothetical protein VI039_01240 [Solirubrobacterales bacterium]